MQKVSQRAPLTPNIKSLFEVNEKCLQYVIRNFAARPIYGYRYRSYRNRSYQHRRSQGGAKGAFTPPKSSQFFKIIIPKRDNYEVNSKMLIPC